MLKYRWVGPLGMMMADVSPPGTAATRLSISYNITASVLGGFTPMMVIWADSGD
ncbi:hypothetical protein [Amycolatopsis echigonensis]|uniref:Uncharacterized protein n=1 Tax=Amycolatopsis echigonensis TaxID=2576905 RepID=A0A8E1W1G9_9PSEU|nr:hypothetical protein [Amycolatopsis echigonensis]MBB2501994.1 hypothetical protein [Amycolatopsis echigonensis]